MSLQVTLDYGRQLYFLLVCWIKSNMRSSSSSCRPASSDAPKTLPPPVSIVHRFQQILKDTSCIGTEQLYIGGSWSSCLCSNKWRGPQEYVAYELVSTSPAVSHMFASSNLESFRDRWLVAVQLLRCWVLPPGLVQYCS